MGRKLFIWCNYEGLITKKIINIHLLRLLDTDMCPKSFEIKHRIGVTLTHTHKHISYIYIYEALLHGWCFINFFPSPQKFAIISSKNCPTLYWCVQGVPNVIHMFTKRIEIFITSYSCYVLQI